jgi:hypothetical protein
MIRLKFNFKDVKTWPEGSSCGQDSGVRGRKGETKAECNTSDDESGVNINDDTTKQNGTTRLASSSLCTNDTNLNTPRILMVGTTRLAWISSGIRNQSARGPLVNIANSPYVSRAALCWLTGDQASDGRSLPRRKDTQSR